MFLGVGAVIADYPKLVEEQFLISKNYPKGGSIPRDDVEPEGEATLGGSAVNVMKVLARLGNKCAVVGPIGDDEVGKEMSRKVDECGLKLLMTPLPGKNARVACYVTRDAERTMVTSLGVIASFKPEHLLDEHFKDATHTHLEGYNIYAGNVLERSVELAKKYKITISLDLSSFQVVERALKRFEAIIKQVDIVFGNTMEMKSLTGAEDPQKACGYFEEYQTIVITEGAKGCTVKPKGTMVATHYDAQPVTKLVDTTGAGDYFAAGFLHGFFRNEKIEVCVKMANQAASRVIQCLGADLVITELT